MLGAADAVADAEFAYLCVPTPQGADGSADLSYIEAAAREIAPACCRPSPSWSTSPPCRWARPGWSSRRSAAATCYVVSNPEFLREGSAVNDFLHPDRVVIGSDDQGAAIRVASLYIGVPAPLMVTDPASAETIKYASNAFLATKLSFVNAVAAVCEAVGADVNDVVLGMGYDKRIGHEFLRPGPGWGGSCFPKDVQALLYIAREAGYHFDLLEGVVERQRRAVRAHGRQGRGHGRRVARRQGRRRVGPHLQGQHRRPARVAGAADHRPAAGPGAPWCEAYDPSVDGPLAEAPGIEVVDDPYAACEGADGARRAHRVGRVQVARPRQGRPT